MSRRMTERRLRAGDRHRLGEVRELFVTERTLSHGRGGKTKHVYRQADQEMLESFEVALARIVTAMLERQGEYDSRVPAEPSVRVAGDQVMLVDLSGIEDADDIIGDLEQALGK